MQNIPNIWSQNPYWLKDTCVCMCVYLMCYYTCYYTNILCIIYSSINCMQHKILSIIPITQWVNHIGILWSKYNPTLKTTYRQLVWHLLLFCPTILFYFIFKDLFIWQTEITSRQSSRQREREEQAPRWAESLIRGLIPGPWDHDLSRRQRLNPLIHPGAPPYTFLSQC